MITLEHPPPPPPPPQTPQGGPDDNTMAVPSVLAPITHCTYDQKGRCDRHGGVGKLRWKPVIKKTEDGRNVIESRDYFYTCVGKKKSGRQMIQQKLVFANTKTTNDVKTTRDDQEDTM